MGTKKVSTIKHYPGIIEIYDTENGFYSLPYDGIKGELTREEWQEDEIIQLFDEESQKQILDEFDLRQITKQ